MGEKLIKPAVPVPLRPTVCGLPGALSARLMAADSLPTCEGVKVTLIVQLAPAATVLPQVFPVRAKSALFVPVNVTLVRLKLALPWFVSVTDCAVLVVLCA